MRFIHTSDWHLGRLFHGIHLTGDQGHLLDQFVALVNGTKPDAVLISGDIYDRSVPPTEAVELFDDTLARLLLDCKVPVVIIGGNHDSPQRIDFGRRLLRASGLHITGMVNAEPEPIEFEDAHGKVHVFGLPFGEPGIVRSRLGDEGIKDHHTAMAGMTTRARKRNGAPRSIVLAHAFVQGGQVSESERPLSIGGTGEVGAEVFEGFNYVALGHLHRPQRVGGTGEIHYSGSLMKYSFDEVDHAKGVNVVEMDGEGRCTVERVVLTPRRDVRVIEGELKDLIRRASEDRAPKDYILARLLDKGPVLDAMGRLRTVYPNIMQIRRPDLEREIEERGEVADPRKTSATELFSAFFEFSTGEGLNDEETKAYAEVVEAMQQQEREAGQ